MKEKNILKVNNSKYALAAFFAVTIFVITYKYTLNEMIAEGVKDMKDHALHASNIYLGTLWESWLHRPYLMWHLWVKGFVKFFHFPLKEAASCACACFSTFCYFVTFVLVNRVADRISGKVCGMLSACMSAALGLVMPMYIYWYNTYQYEGQFTINPFFNPTHMAVKPFGLLTFMFGIDLILRYRGESLLFGDSRRYQKSLYVLFGTTLFLSAFTKPTFMYMLLPAGAIYLLIDLGAALVRKDHSAQKVWGFMWRLAVACIPSILYLLLEYSAFYFWGGTNSDASVVIGKFLTAWHIYSPNVPKSVLLAMAFPLWMVVTNLRYFAYSVEGRFSAIAYGVGTLEFACFMETGDKLGHLNFSWCMMSGMLLLWVIAGAKLIALTAAGSDTKWQAIKVTVAWILLILHVYSGTYYINPFQYII
jgi:hypothetical protein